LTIGSHETPASVTVVPGSPRESAALVVADNESVARLAPRWAVELAGAGRRYRVRLLSIGSPAELEAVAAEARSLSAGLIIAAGGERLQASAAQVARQAGLPVVVWDDSTGG